MKKQIKIQTTQECWSLVENITYATEPAWYGATYRDLKCSVCIPKHREKVGKYPLLIWLCGGGFQVMDKDVWWPQWIEFARKGVIVASVEYRTNNETCFPDSLADVKAAIRYFRAHADRYSVDPERIFVGGESAGGALASLAGVSNGEAHQKFEVGEWLETSSKVQGVIDFYGVVDMTIRPLGKDQELASAIRYVTPDTPPFLIFHGNCDDLVPIDQSERMYETLCENGVRADYYVLDGEGHGADAFYQQEIMEIIREFMDGIQG